jgi:hypothetical protein
MPIDEMNPMIPISSNFIELFSHQLPNKVFRPSKIGWTCEKYFKNHDK